MGLMDKLFGGLDTSTSSFTTPEAFAGILLGASACDGHIADGEFAGLVSCLLRMKLYHRFTDKLFNSMLNKLHGIVKRKGVDALLEGCCKVLPKALHRTAFANACDIILADGIVEQDEKDFLDKLRVALKIDKEAAKTIAEIMIVKNKG